MCKIAKVLLVGKEGILIARLGIDILPGVQSDFILHPLIRTWLEFDLAQNVENRKAEPRTPLFFKSRYCTLLSRAKVGIKVCYMKSHWNGRRVYIITLKANSNEFTTRRAELPETLQCLIYC
jgi:hypothetical protein